MKSGGGPSAADNIANYTLESPVGSSISLGGKTVTHDGPTMSAKISGLALQNGNTFKVTVGTLTQDIWATLFQLFRHSGRKYHLRNSSQLYPDRRTARPRKRAATRRRDAGNESGPRFSDKQVGRSDI